MTASDSRGATARLLALAAGLALAFYPTALFAQG
jgi:hypothetical protein